MGARVGLSKAWAGMLGASLGNLLLVSLSALGVGLLVSQNHWVFNAIKWGGAAYLIYLGIICWHTPLGIVQAQATESRTSTYAVFFSGLMIAVSNPKGLIYFGALFPQFIDYQAPLFGQFLVLTLTFLATDILWMMIYALAGKQVMGWLTRPGHQRLFNQLSGSLLAGAGLLMALSGNP